MSARRYNTGKLRYDLLPIEGLEEVLKVYTLGVHKYTIYRGLDGSPINGSDISIEEAKNLEIIDSGDNNWRNGLSWASSMASVERHIAEWKKCEDHDELGTLHLANAAWGLLTLLSYYTIHPQGDDRNHWFTKPLKRVWLDLDGVVFDFEQHFLTHLGLPTHHPVDWNDYRFRDNLHLVDNDEDFWLSCPLLISPSDVTYPIVGYCTSRLCTPDLIHRIISKANLPKGEVIVLDKGISKSLALVGKCDVYIDDSIENFIDLNSNGVLCYLHTRPHNIKYNAAHLRVKSLIEFFEKVKLLT